VRENVYVCLSKCLYVCIDVSLSVSVFESDGRVHVELLWNLSREIKLSQKWSAMFTGSLWNDLNLSPRAVKWASAGVSFGAGGCFLPCQRWEAQRSVRRTQSRSGALLAGKVIIWATHEKAAIGAGDAERQGHSS